MAKRKTFDQFVDRYAEDPRRAIVIAVIVLIIVLAIFFLRNEIKSLFNKLSNNSQSKDELNEYTEQTGQRQTLTDTSLRSLANRIEQASYDDNWLFGLGTNEDKIYNAFNELNNTADLLRLKVLYGTRHNRTLDETITSELSNGERKKLNTILTNKGIDYTF